MTDAERQRAFRERRAAKLARIEKLEATLVVIRDVTADRLDPFGRQIHAYALDALAMRS